MSEKKRQCGTCRFFVETKDNGHGKCTHPGRDESIRAMVLLRPTELGCRTRWGTSLWQDKSDDRDPTAPEAPQQPTLPEPEPAQLHYDDEVTSVSIAGSKPSRPSLEDDVVDSGAVAAGRTPWNDSLQDERRRLLMNSDRDALAGARKRHMEKQARQRELIPFADEDETSTDTKAETTEEPTLEVEKQVAESKPSFPPDDYVEEERSAENDSSGSDDELVDDGVNPGGIRTPRGRRLTRENKSPKENKAMRFGVSAEMSVTSHNPEHREQWNSVPSVTPGFDLPLINQPTSRPSVPLRVSASAASSASTPTQNRPVSQARELLSEDRLREERARRHVEVPLADDDLPLQPEFDEPKQTVTNRPRLTQAPPQQAPQVDRLKSSPLRGYHPAVKAAAARTEENEPAVSEAEQVRSGTATPYARRDMPRVYPTHQPQSRPAAQRSEREQPRDDRQERPFQAQPARSTELRSEQPRQREQVRMAQPQRKPVIPLQRVEEATPFNGTEIEISPEVPRCCGTCASFRPSEVEGRGSCANAFAGPVQRVVFDHDLACQHTFGSFWIPADEEVWLDELKTDFAPTPRVERMIARRKETSRPVLPDLDELTS